MYNHQTLGHVIKPRNVGPLVGSTHRGTAGLQGDGPYVSLEFVVEDGVVTQAAYTCNGCPGAIATASALAEWANGRSTSEVLGLKPTDLLSLLGGLPEGKEHNADRTLEAVRSAFVEKLR